MNNSKLFSMLKSLSEKEWKSFLAFLSSPYFNKNEQNLMLARHLYRYRKQLDDTNHFDHESLAIQLFSRFKQPHQRLKDHMTNLVDLLKQFMIQQEWEAQTFERRLGLMSQLRGRALDKLYLSEQKKLVQLMDKIPSDSEDYYYQQFRYWEEIEAHLLQKDGRKKEDSLQAMADSFDTYYFSRKLKGLCEMSNRALIINREYDQFLAKEILAILDGATLAQLSVPIIQLHQLVYLSLTTKEEEHFNNLINLLNQEDINITKAEAQHFYNHAQNYCIRKINQGEASYMEKIFELYQQMLEKSLIHINGWLPHPHYKNIVTVGLRLKEYDWVKAFIEDYKEQLSEDIRDNAYNYNLAYYLYETAHHDEMISLLNTVEFTDVYYEIGAKYILLKTYYDLDELDLLSYLIISFERFLKRNKAISAHRRKGEINFLSVLKKLARLKEVSDYKSKEYVFSQKEKINNDLSTKKPIVNVNWLKEKWNEF